MASLNSLLQNAASSLSAHRASSATASHNLQNANTPGYARQRANLEAALPSEMLGGAYLGRGVILGTVTQARDRFIEAQMPSAMASAARSGAEASALTSVTAFDAMNEGGMTAGLGAFYSSVRQLAQNPADQSLRAATVAAAQQLTLSFNSASTQLNSARAGIDEKVRASAPEINQLLNQMASLNGQVRTARGTGAEPNDLLDARQAVQDKLTQLTGAVPVPNSDGDVNLQLPGGGGALVTGNKAAQLATFPDSTNSGHLGVHLVRADGTLSENLADRFGGTLGGLVSARDGALRSAQTQLDTLAFDMANTMNTVHSAGYALDGSTGRNLFVVGAAAEGAAGRLTLNADIANDPRLLAAASAPGDVPGGNGNMQALLGTETMALSGGLDTSSTLANITSSFGAASQRAVAAATADSSLQSHLTDMRESVSGVSIDEELINLTQAQRGYEAVLKVITTANEMLNTLMQLR